MIVRAAPLLVLEVCSQEVRPSSLVQFAEPASSASQFATEAKRVVQARYPRSCSGRQPGSPFVTVSRVDA
jgi:hypothetical protein